MSIKYFILAKGKQAAYATDNIREAEFFYNLSTDYEILDADMIPTIFQPVKYIDFKYPHIIMLQNIPNKGKK